MSEKPFWEGKTCKEMAGLHIKVTFKNGDVATGVADKNGDIKSAYVLTLGMGDDLFVPEADIESIELVDDPEYERIDNIEDVHAGDIFVAKSGNRYDIWCVDPRRGRPVFGVSIEGEVRECIGSKSFAYALRLKLRLPDEPGLWLDKDDNTWTMRDGSVQMTCIGADDWCFTRAWFYSNIPKLVDDGLDSLSILVIFKTLEIWAQKGYELYQPIAQRFHGGRR